MPTIDIMVEEITQRYPYWTIESNNRGYAMTVLSTHDPVEHTTIYAHSMSELIRHVWMYYYGGAK